MRLSVVVLLLGALLIAGCAKNTQWSKYTSREGGFSIYMPSEITKSEKREVTPFGKQTTHFITWKPSSFAIDKFKLFQVSYTDCPARYTTDSAHLNSILDSCIDLRKMDFNESKDIESQVIELNGYPGRAFIYDEPRGTTIAIVKICIVNNKKYDVTVVAKKSYPTNNEIAAFFNSFQVLK